MANPKLLNVFLGDNTLSICKTKGFEKENDFLTTNITNRNLFSKYYNYSNIPPECLGMPRDLMWGSKKAEGWRANIIYFDFLDKKPFTPDVSPALIVENRRIKHELEMAYNKIAELKAEVRAVNNKDRYREKVNKDMKFAAEQKNHFHSNDWFNFGTPPRQD